METEFGLATRSNVMSIKKEHLYAVAAMLNISTNVPIGMLRKLVREHIPSLKAGSRSMAAGGCAATEQATAREPRRPAKDATERSAKEKKEIYDKLTAITKMLYGEFRTLDMEQELFVNPEWHHLLLFAEWLQNHEQFIAWRSNREHNPDDALVNMLQLSSSPIVLSDLSINNASDAALSTDNDDSLDSDATPGVAESLNYTRTPVVSSTTPLTPNFISGMDAGGTTLKALRSFREKKHLWHCSALEQQLVQPVVRVIQCHVTSKTLNKNSNQLLKFGLLSTKPKKNTVYQGSLVQFRGLILDGSSDLMPIAFFPSNADVAALVLRVGMKIQLLKYSHVNIRLYDCTYRPCILVADARVLAHDKNWSESEESKISLGDPKFMVRDELLNDKGRASDKRKAPVENNAKAAKKQKANATTNAKAAKKQKANAIMNAKERKNGKTTRREISRELSPDASATGANVQELDCTGVVVPESFTQKPTDNVGPSQAMSSTRGTNTTVQVTGRSRTRQTRTHGGDPEDSGGDSDNESKDSSSSDEDPPNEVYHLHDGRRHLHVVIARQVAARYRKLLDDNNQALTIPYTCDGTRCTRRFFDADTCITAIAPPEDVSLASVHRVCPFSTSTVGRLSSSKKRCLLYWYYSKSFYHLNGSGNRRKLPHCLISKIRSLYPNSESVPYRGFELFRGLEDRPETGEAQIDEEDEADDHNNPYGLVYDNPERSDDHEDISPEDIDM